MKNYHKLCKMIYTNLYEPSFFEREYFCYGWKIPFSESNGLSSITTTEKFLHHLRMRYFSK